MLLAPHSHFYQILSYHAFWGESDKLLHTSTRTIDLVECVALTVRILLSNSKESKAKEIAFQCKAGQRRKDLGGTRENLLANHIVWMDIYPKFVLSRN